MNPTQADQERKQVIDQIQGQPSGSCRVFSTVKGKKEKTGPSGSTQEERKSKTANSKMRSTKPPYQRFPIAASEKGQQGIKD